MAISRMTKSCYFKMLTDGCWSPTRPSLFFTTRNDGWMEAWDIIENQKSPVLTHKVQEGPVHCMSAHPEGFLLCIGGDKGEVSMIQLSSGLVEVNKVDQYHCNFTLIIVVIL